MIEHAPPSRRALFGSLAQSSAMMGGLLGAAAGWLVSYVLPADQLTDWGWRLPFLFGVVVGGLGLWVRIGIHDTPVFKDISGGNSTERWPLLAALRLQKKPMLICVGLNWASSVGYFLVFAWFVGFMTDVIGMSLHVANGIGAVALGVGMTCTVVFGYLADRLGLRHVLTAGIIATAVCAIPLMLVASIGTIWAAIAAQFGLAVLMSALFGTLPALNVSLFLPTLRCTAFSASYNVSVAIAGGSAPLIATTLIQQSGWSMAPGIYVSVSMVVGLVALAFVPKERFQSG
jgi:MHS family proline/betaine transporter-like MFS transporter